MMKSEKINKLLAKELIKVGAESTMDKSFPFETYGLMTSVGMLQVHLSTPYSCRSKNAVICVYSRFNDPERASRITNCNPYSGKWNFVFYANQFTAEQFVEYVMARIKNIL